MFDILLIIAPLVLFFVVQVIFNKELPLFILAAVMSLFVIWQGGTGAALLFGIGVAISLIVEVGLGFVLRTQHWENASFFGIPYWLPLAWGYGFVVIHQIGELVFALVS
ncbi:MAG: hypothetical protein RLY47_378 [Candidatus Parcubacteria bacterium]|jgi:hypothetical protein